MLDIEIARSHAESWIDAWNRHDLDAIMDHYADDIELRSPYIARLLNQPDGIIRGKEAVRAYFVRGLQANPFLHFELLHVLYGVDSLTIFFRRETGAYAAEWTMLDASGKSASVRAQYDPPP